MSVELIAKIVDVTSALTKEELIGGSLTDQEIEALVVELVHTGRDLYEEHTGEPMSPDLIKAEGPI